MTKTLTIQGIDELKRVLDSAGRLDDKVYAPLHRAFNEATKQMEAQAKENVTANNSVASGQLRAGITSDVTITPAELTGVVSAVAKGANGYNYAPAVEYGTSPHWPPLEPLVEWVRLKHLAGSYSVKSHRRLGGAVRRLDEDTQLARAIQRKIARRGTKARPFMEPAFESKKNDIARLIEKGIDQAVRNIGK